MLRSHKPHKPVKMVIVRDVNDDPMMCKFTELHNCLIEDGLPYTIEKIFDSLTWYEANQRFYDHQDFGKYEGVFPNSYLDDSSQVDAVSNDDQCRCGHLRSLHAETSAGPDYCIGCDDDCAPNYGKVDNDEVQ